MSQRPTASSANGWLECEVFRVVGVTSCVSSATSATHSTQQSQCVYIHVVARSNSCKNVVLRGCARLRGSLSYFIAARSSQMNYYYYYYYYYFICLRHNGP